MSKSLHADENGVSYDAVCALCHLRRGTHNEGRCYYKVCVCGNFAREVDLGTNYFLSAPSGVMRTWADEQKLLLTLGEGTHLVSRLTPVGSPIGVTASGLPVYAAGTRAYIEKMHTPASSVYSNQLLDADVAAFGKPPLSPKSKYAGRECPCGMASADCEYHR